MLAALFHRRHHEGEACGDPFLLLSGLDNGFPHRSAVLNDRVYGLDRGSGFGVMGLFKEE